MLIYEGINSSKIDITANSFLARFLQKPEESCTLANARVPSYQDYESGMRNCPRCCQEVISIASD